MGMDYYVMKWFFFNETIDKNACVMMKRMAQLYINRYKDYQSKLLCNNHFEQSLTAMQKGLQEMLKDNVTMSDFQLMQQDDGKVVAVDVHLSDYGYFQGVIFEGRMREPIYSPTKLVDSLLNFCKKKKQNELTQNQQYNIEGYRTNQPDVYDINFEDESNKEQVKQYN